MKLLVTLTSCACIAAATTFGSPARAESTPVVASQPILLLTDTATSEDHSVDGIADKLGKANTKHYDTLFIGQRKMGDSPITLTRLVLDFPLPVAPAGQTLASATLTVHYLNDRAFDRSTPPVRVFHVASDMALPNGKQAALDLYADDTFQDTGLDLIRNGMPLGPVSVDLTAVLAPQYADNPTPGHALLRLQSVAEPILRGAQPPLDNRYGIQGFVEKDGSPQPPTLTLTFERR